MSQNQAVPVHPGHYVRETVLAPRRLNVTAAAKSLSVGRQALSNFLNGNSALSPDMATRLSKAFGCDRKELLDLQARFDRHELEGKDKELVVPSYVPALTEISARDIEGWASKSIAARSQLAALLRTLIHSTARDLQSVEFPAHDNAERHGWDGMVLSGAANPWVPIGRSGWEFGCTAEPKIKAENDYRARTSSVPEEERLDTTFVFVTPHNWPEKVTWQKHKSASGDWKSVRALDASDLEQWVEQSLHGQIWLAEKLGRPVDGYATLEECWRRWSFASQPPLPKELFSGSIKSFRNSFISWLNSSPNEPFIVAADSTDEALAFLASLMEDEEIAARPGRDLPIVFTAPGALRKLASASSAFIPVVSSHDTERELAPFQGRLHCIVTRPRNAVDSDPDVVLDLLRHDDFKKALELIGLGEEEIDKLAHESGRSLTILRRRRSTIPAIRKPAWAQDSAIVRRMIPLALAGAWHAGTKADCEIVALLARSPYEDVEAAIAQILPLNDCPLWSVGKYRGVASKIDALFAIGGALIEKDIEDFLLVAEYVLSERDPALDLSEADRWAAGIYGKLRDHSAALRAGISETLVLLGVYGDDLFHERLGVPVVSNIARLVEKLLTPLTIEKILSHDRDLPSYAEAAPETFLKLIEEDLRKDQPVVFDLLKPVESSFFGSGCPRTGLLWALEGLAWKPQNLQRVVDILGRLSTKEINDNWANKPKGSLQAIFRSWMPQTSAVLVQRIQALERLMRNFPSVGWAICVRQLETGSSSGHYSHRPKWRSDASGAGQPISRLEDYQFVRKCIELAIDWPEHDEKTLGDLIERLQAMSPEHQSAVWDKVDEWTAGQEDDSKKAGLRERVRRYAFTQRARNRALPQATRDRASVSYSKLSPKDRVLKHLWLFEKAWVEESLDERESADVDFKKRDERVAHQRTEALKEIWVDQGVSGLLALLARSDASHVVGSVMSAVIVDRKERAEFVLSCLAVDKDEVTAKVKWCLGGFFIRLADDENSKLTKGIIRKIDQSTVLTLFLCLPFRQSTWRLLDEQAPGLRSEYWGRVSTHWADFTTIEANELIDRLLEVKRPAAAFDALHLDWKKVETSRLKKLLLALPRTPNEKPCPLKIASHDISAALTSLGGRAGVSVDDMGNLEFLYLSALDHSEHGIPNLERQIARAPSLYVQALGFAFKRNDGKDDLPEWRIDDEKRRHDIASATYSLLERVSRIPGTDEETGEIKIGALKDWLSEVRAACDAQGRKEIGAQMIGQLLSRAPRDPDGVWPCKAVCEAMEWMGSKHVGLGFKVATRNARGAHWRGDDGDDERELAARYRGWAEKRAFEFPYVASVLESIATSYDREAQWHDSDAKIKSRLRY